MNHDELVEHLKKLHGELTTLEHPDHDVRSLLATVHEDIDRLEEAIEHEGEEGGLASRLESLAATFEAEHPTLARAARDLIERLSAMGI